MSLQDLQETNDQILKHAKEIQEHHEEMRQIYTKINRTVEAIKSANDYDHERQKDLMERREKRLNAQESRVNRALYFNNFILAVIIAVEIFLLYHTFTN